MLLNWCGQDFDGPVSFIMVMSAALLGYARGNQVYRWVNQYITAATSIHPDDDSAKHGTVP